jgi:hypothetical protein
VPYLGWCGGPVAPGVWVVFVCFSGYELDPLNDVTRRMLSRDVTVAATKERRTALTPCRTTVAARTAASRLLIPEATTDGSDPQRLNRSQTAAATTRISDPGKPAGPA